MEDAEYIDVEVKTGSKSQKSPKEGVTKKSAEKIDLRQKLDRTQSQVQDEDSEKDAGEPMDVDPMSDLPGEGENPTTPDRRHSVVVIEDSSHRVKEESIRDRD